MKRPPIIRLRGIRQVIPSGYVMGRVSPGDGDAELIPVSLFAAKQAATGIVAPGSGGPNYMDAQMLLSAGTLYSGQYYPFAPAPVAITFPSLRVDPVAKAQIAPSTATAKIHITSDVADFQTNGIAGTKTICTFTFPINTATATVVQRNQVSIARGDFLYAVIDLSWTETAITQLDILVPGDF